MKRRAGAAAVLALATALGCRSTAPGPGAAYLIDPSPEAAGGKDPGVERAFERLRHGDATVADVPGSDAAHRVLAIQIRLVQGDLAAARSLCTAAMSSGIQTAAALAACGEVEARLGAWADAHDLFQGAILRRPDDAGLAALRQNAAPRAAQEWVGNAGSLLRQGEAHEARLAAERAVAIAPGNVPALGLAGEAAAADGDENAAFQYLRDAWRGGGKSEYGEKAGELALRLRKPDEAVQIFTKLTAEDSRYRARLNDAAEEFVISNWRPEEREAAWAERLTRAQAAVLLLRIVPGLDTALPSAPTAVATDILSRPDQKSLTRAIALGLIPVDAATHRARPDSDLTRTDAIRMIVRAAQLAGPAASRRCVNRSADPDAAAAACGITLRGSGRFVSGPGLRDAAQFLAEKRR